MKVQKAILVASRHYVNNADLVDYSIAGVDRRKTLDEAISRVPANLRTQLAKQLGPVLERETFDTISVTSIDASTKSAAFMTVCVVDIVLV
jgi:hypothetical protein